MPRSPVALFLDKLRSHGLLSAAQVQEIEAHLDTDRAELKQVAQFIVQKKWLTRYQLNEVAKNRAKHLFLGSYVLLDKLGEGGMGQVFKAHHQRMNRIVALKLIRKDRLASKTAVERFFQEVQAAAQLTHPNIVLAFDAGEVEGTHYFAMEYVDGIDLACLVRQKGPLAVPLACEFIRQAALGLQHAHESGLVHRDIKPANLIASHSAKHGESVRLKILDLGLARLGQADGEGNGLTREGTVMGSPDYLAPEQARNAHQADIRADLYSLGCTFHFLLVGRPPFKGNSLTETLLKHQVEDPVSVSEVRPEAPVAVTNIITKLLAKSPQDRFQTPTELIEAIDASGLAQGHGASLAASSSGSDSVWSHVADDAEFAQPDPTPKKSMRQRSWLRPSVAGGGGVILVGGIALAFLLAGRKLPTNDLPPASQKSDSLAARPPGIPSRPIEPPPKKEDGSPASRPSNVAPTVTSAALTPAPVQLPAPLLVVPPPQAAGHLAGFWKLAWPSRYAGRCDLTVREMNGAFTVQMAVFATNGEFKGNARCDDVRPEPDGSLKVEPLWDRPMTAPLDIQELSLRSYQSPRPEQDGPMLSGSCRTRTNHSYFLYFASNGGETPVVPTSTVKSHVPRPEASIKVVKSDPPSADKVREVAKTVRETFAKEYVAAKKTAAHKLTLADKLFKLGQDSKDDPGARFVLLSEARDLCVQGGRWDLAAEALDALDREFKIDLLGLRESALQTLSKAPLNKDVALDAVEAALRFMGEAVVAEQPGKASAFLKVASILAARAQSVATANQIKKHEVELKLALEDHDRARVARETLMESASDPAAHLALGRYLAFRKGAWDEGLNHLAQGGEGDLRDLARSEMTKPQDVKEQLKLGDRWWGLAEKEKDSLWLRSAYLQRAGHWYRRTQPQTNGLTAKLLGERLRTIDEAPSPLRVTLGDASAELRRFKGHPAAITSLVPAADGKRLFSGSLDGTVRVWDLVSANLRGTYKASGPVHALDLSPQQRWLAVNGKETVQVLDANNGKSGTAIVAEPAIPGSFWVEADRLKMITPTLTYKTYDVVTQFSSSADFALMPPAIKNAHDRQHFVTLGKDVRLFRTDSGGGCTELRTFLMPEATCAAFAPDGRWLALAGTDMKIRLFDVDSVQAKITLEGLTSPPRCLAVAPAGTRLLSGGDDKVLRLWDVANGREITRLTHSEAVSAVSFTSDGRAALSASGDHLIRMWSLPRERTGPSGIKAAGAPAAKKSNLPHLNPPAPGRPSLWTALLLPTDSIDKNRKTPAKVHTIDLKAGKAYVIELNSTTFDPYLRLEDPRGVAIAEDDDGGGNFNSRLVFHPPTDGRYRLVAMPLVTGRYGQFLLRVSEQ